MANLFAQPTGPRPLVSFRAGRMVSEGNLVRPDSRRGRIELTFSDNLLHFSWKDRATGVVEEEFVIFPDTAHWFRVEKCTTGRVYALEFTDTPGRIHFYWVQEPKDTMDQENAAKINELIRNPQAASRRGIGLDRNQLLGLLAGLGSLDIRGQPQHAAQPPPPPPQPRQQVELATLRNILSGLDLTPPEDEGSDAPGDANDKPEGKQRERREE